MVQATDRFGATETARTINRFFARHDRNSGARLSFAEIFGGRQSIENRTVSAPKAAGSTTTATAVRANTQTTANDLQAALLTLQTVSQGEVAAKTAAVTSPAPAASAPQSSAAPLPTTVAMPVSASKPNTAQFMAATGADFKTASSVLYGVIGSNQDLRDWSAIMSSPDPVAAARAATGAMYNSSQNYLSAEATRPQDRPDTTVLAQAGNFVYYKEKIPELEIDNFVFALVDSNGYQLTSAANSSRVPTLAQNFGFDTSSIKSMEQQLDSQGITFRGGAWPNGFLS